MALNRTWLAWPAVQRRLGIVTPVLALAVLISVPFTVSAGKWLYDRVEHAAAAKAHEALGTSILPWVIAMFVVAALQWTWYRFDEKRRAGTAVEIKRNIQLGTVAVLTTIMLVSAVGSVVTVIRIGDSGATAVWEDNFDS